MPYVSCFIQRRSRNNALRHISEHDNNLACITLPECHKRGKRVSETQIECRSNHFVGADYAIRLISLCLKPCPFLDKPDLIIRKGNCVHFGEQNGLIDCQSCQGTVKLKTFACAVHETCTLGKRLDGIACCAGCDDYRSK